MTRPPPPPPSGPIQHVPNTHAFTKKCLCQQNSLRWVEDFFEMFKETAKDRPVGARQWRRRLECPSRSERFPVKMNTCQQTHLQLSFRTMKAFRAHAFISGWDLICLVIFKDLLNCPLKVVLHQRQNEWHAFVVLLQKEDKGKESCLDGRKRRKKPTHVKNPRKPQLTYKKLDRVEFPTKVAENSRWTIMVRHKPGCLRCQAQHKAFFFFCAKAKRESGREWEANVQHLDNGHLSICFPFFLWGQSVFFRCFSLVFFPQINAGGQ